MNGDCPCTTSTYRLGLHVGTEITIRINVSLWEVFADEVSSSSVLRREYCACWTNCDGASYLGGGFPDDLSEMRVVGSRRGVIRRLVGPYFNTRINTILSAQSLLPSKVFNSVIESIRYQLNRKN